MNINDPEVQGNRKPKDLTKEDKAFRALLREKAYLSGPFIIKPLSPLVGTPLDPTLAWGKYLVTSTCTLNKNPCDHVKEQLCHSTNRQYLLQH